MSTDKKFDHTGSSFDSFLQDEGILEETEAVAVKRVRGRTEQKAPPFASRRMGYSTVSSAQK